jgi:PIN domain nuclease of toxin-antitoxin system
MNYLLDTHTFVWAISEKAKLSLAASKIIERNQGDLFVSAVTFWEISLKHSIGKLKIEGISPEHLPELSNELGFQAISLSAGESSTYNKLPLTTHKDPFDRMLIWQAITRNLTLISKDESMQLYTSSGLQLIW